MKREIYERMEQELINLTLENCLTQKEIFNCASRKLNFHAKKF